MTALAIARRALGGKTDKDRLTYKSTRNAERMSHGATRPYAGGEELQRQSSKQEDEPAEERAWFKPIGSFAGGGGMRPTPATDNFKGIPGGIGGLGGGPAGQALSVARRMGSIPQGADPRPGYGQNMTGMQEGGHAQQTHESGSAIRSAYEDKMAALLPPSAQKNRATASKKGGDEFDPKALQELSKLMEPGLPNPFDELKDWQAQDYLNQARREPTGFEPGEHIPTPRAAPYSIRQEPPTVDTARWLDSIIPYIGRFRHLLNLQNLADRSPIAQAFNRASGSPTEPANAREMMSLPVSQPSFRPADAVNIPTPADAAPIPGLEHMPMGRRSGMTEHHEHKTAAKSKKGGVAKKALALAKRKRKGSKKRSK